MKTARLRSRMSRISEARIARKVERIILMAGAAPWAPTILVTWAFTGLIVLTIKALIIPGLWRTSLAIALITLLMLISTGFRASDEIGSWISLSGLAFIVALIILWPVTYEVKDRGSVMAYIIFLVFCIACFDYMIDVYERERKEGK